MAAVLPTEPSWSLITNELSRLRRNLRFPCPDRLIIGQYNVNLPNAIPTSPPRVPSMNNHGEKVRVEAMTTIPTKGLGREPLLTVLGQPPRTVKEI